MPTPKLTCLCTGEAVDAYCPVHGAHVQQPRAASGGALIDAEFFLKHETTYTQKPSGRYEWRCSCGDSSEDFATWTDCHRQTRKHWAYYLNAALTAHDQKVREQIADELAAPYPEEVFTPLSDAELANAVDALTMKSDVKAASDRLHASWARHWAKQIRASRAEEKP